MNTRSRVLAATHIVTALIAALALSVLPAIAQTPTATTGVVSGVVNDASGAVLPGVTVEAASPALIEKVRAATTDAQGNYKIVDLRPGTYSVTFSLPGFGTFKRDGLELTTGFTATANAELKVGSLEETVTVSGASPVGGCLSSRRCSFVRRSTFLIAPSLSWVMNSP